MDDGLCCLPVCNAQSAFVPPLHRTALHRTALHCAAGDSQMRYAFAAWVAFFTAKSRRNFMVHMRLQPKVGGRGGRGGEGGAGRQGEREAGGWAHVRAQL